MPTRSIAVHKIKRIIWLSHEAERYQRGIALACGLSQPPVRRVLKRAREAGLAVRLHCERPRRAAARRAEPDF